MQNFVQFGPLVSKEEPKNDTPTSNLKTLCKEKACVCKEMTAVYSCCYKGKGGNILQGMLDVPGLNVLVWAWECAQSCPIIKLHQESSNSSWMYNTKFAVRLLTSTFAPFLVKLLYKMSIVMSNAISILAICGCYSTTMCVHSLCYKNVNITKYASGNLCYCRSQLSSALCLILLSALWWIITAISLWIGVILLSALWWFITAISLWITLLEFWLRQIGKFAN